MKEDKIDYYEILDIDYYANEREIKYAYRKLARQYHPDVNNNDPAANERMKEINKAYEILSDATKKKQYDDYFFSEASLKKTQPIKKKTGGDDWSRGGRNQDPAPVGCSSFVWFVALMVILARACH